MTSKTLFKAPLFAAAALMSAPGAAVGQSGAMPEVEPARVIEAAETCRGAPTDFQQALSHAREQGFGDLPAEESRRMPFTTLQRGGVRLILIGGGGLLPGSCKVYANVGSAASLEALAAQLESALGEAAIPAGGTDWWFEDRTVHADLSDGRFRINVIFQRVDREDMVRRAERTADEAAQSAAVAESEPPAMEGTQVAAAAENTSAPAETDAQAPTTEMRPTSPATEIAAAATACVASLERGRLDVAALRRAGWSRRQERLGAGIHSRDGSQVRIFTTGIGGGQCIVDAYGERMDGFDAIRDAIRASLVERFGDDVALPTATGAEGDFSRGQGFTVGNRIGILSSERRADGLSIRFTTMSMDGMGLR